MCDGERLTRVDEDGTVLCIGCVEEEECNGACLSCQHDIDAIEKLAEYEVLEEQGLILRLPCKVGDEFFVIAYIDNKITHVRCSGYTISVDDIRKKSNFSVIWIDSVENPRDYWRLTFEEFKNQCFKTKEEAEQALERMVKENG